MRIVRFIGALLILISSPAMAKDAVAAWIVTQKSGDVRVLRNGLQPASVQLRASLSPGDMIATGATGRAVITKGEDYVVVAPGSRLILPKEQQQTGFTRLIQQVGTMLYKVKRTGVPHFAVDTPMLAAVVKGTTFTVVVDKDRAAVQVTEGVVEVSSLSGDARRLVEGGATVYVGRERPNDILDVKPGSADLPASGDEGAVMIKGSSDVSLATITNLTAGLVRQAPIAPAAAVANAGSAGIVNIIPGSGLAVAPASSPQIAPTDLVTPVTDLVEAVAAPVTEPVVGIVETVVAPVTAPVVNIVEGVVAPVTAPVVDIVEAVVSPVTEPVVNIVEQVVAPVTEPVVNIVEQVVAPVTEPVVNIVEQVVAPVTAPVIDIVETILPPVAPVIDVVQTIVPPILGGLFGR